MFLEQMLSEQLDKCFWTNVIRTNVVRANVVRTIVVRTNSVRRNVTILPI